MNAEEFIAKNIDQYGLAGSNMTANPQRFKELKGSGILHFSHDNHFAWGYSGHTYNFRRSITDVYFTEFYVPKQYGTVLSLERELVQAAEQWSDTFCGVMVVNRGRAMDYAVVEACRRAGIDFKQIVVHLHGAEPVIFDGRVCTTQITNTENEIKDKIDDVVPWFRTRSVENIIDMLVLDLPWVGENHVAFPSTLHLVNHNSQEGKMVGPPNWSLCNAEEDSAIIRYDYFKPGGTRSIPVGVWSPALMAAQLCDPCTKEWIAGAGGNAPNNWPALVRMWERASPIQAKDFEMPSWYCDVMDYMDTVHDKGKCNEKWYTPLPRILDRIGASYPYELDTDEAYGVVYDKRNKP